MTICDINLKQKCGLKKNRCTLNHKVSELKEERFTTNICRDNIIFLSQNFSNNLSNIRLDEEVLKTS